MTKSPANPYPVVFLDVDGVLITTASRSAPDPRCVAELNRITDVTGAGIVVSSSRRGAGVSSIARILRGWGVTGRIVGVTPDRSRSRGPLYIASPRGLEIQAWLDAHPEVTAFVILDDEADMAHLAAHLVQTDYAFGLTRERGDLAILHLQPAPAPPANIASDFPTFDDLLHQSRVLIEAFSPLSRIPGHAIHLILEPLRTEATKLTLMIEALHVRRGNELSLLRTSGACEQMEETRETQADG